MLSDVVRVFTTSTSQDIVTVISPKNRARAIRRRQQTIKRTLLMGTALIAGVYAANGIALGLTAPVVHNQEAMPAEVAEWATSHPDVRVIVADHVTIGFGQETGGYVYPGDEVPTIYLATYYVTDDVDMNWEYVLEHEYAHIHQTAYIGELTNATPSFWNPVGTAQYYTGMYQVSDVAAQAFVGAETRAGSQAGLDGLEFSADCYAQLQTNTSMWHSYVGEEFCTMDQQVAAYASAGYTDPQSEILATVSARKLAEAAERAADLQAKEQIAASEEKSKPINKDEDNS